MVLEEATVAADGQKLLMEVAQRGQQRQSAIKLYHLVLATGLLLIYGSHAVCRGHIQGRSTELSCSYASDSATMCNKI